MSVRLLCLALLTCAAHAAAQVAPAGTLVVTNKQPATATLVDIATGRTLATLPTGFGPHEVVTSRDGRTAVVTDYGTGPQPGRTLTVIDVPGLRVARTIDLGDYRRPHGIQFLPGDSLVAVTVEGSQAVLVVHVASGAIRRAIVTSQTSTHMVAVADDGVRAWTSNIGSNTVSELNLATGALVRHVTVPARPEAIGITGDGSEVWVGSNDTHVVSVVASASGAVSEAANGLEWPYRVVFTPDAAMVVLPDYRGEVVRFVERATRRELGRLAFTGGGPQGVTITPDGRTAYLSLSSKATVVAIDLATRTVLREFSVGPTPDGVAFAAPAAPPTSGRRP